MNLTIPRNVQIQISSGDSPQWAIEYGIFFDLRRSEGACFIKFYIDIGSRNR